MLKQLISLLLLIVFLSCLLAPPIYSLITLFWTDFPWPFSRVYDRVFLIIALLVLGAYRKKLKMPALRFAPAKYLKIHGRTILIGLSISLIGSAIALFASVSSGVLDWLKPDISVALTKTLKALLAAAIVSVLEEAIFRGVVYRKLAAVSGHWKAALIASSFYAVMHFIAPDRTFVYPGWSPLAGFQYFGLLIANVASDGVFEGVVGLFLVGLVLCDAVRRTGNLALAIGLHAGWIIALKLSLLLTSEAPGVTFPEGIGRRYFFVAQPSTWLSVVLVWILVTFAFKRGRRE